MQSSFARYFADVHARLRSEPGGESRKLDGDVCRGDDDLFGIAMTTADGHTYAVGDAEVPFSIQSISKVFCYAIALEDRGFDYVDSKIDVEPSGSSYNDISSEPGSGRPKNALINIGAIAATSLITPEEGGTVTDRILRMLSACAARELTVDEEIYRLDYEAGAHNRALAWFLASWGIIDGDPFPAFDDYTRQCAVAVTAKDLSVMAATLANLGKNPVTGEQVFSPAVCERVLSLMLTCGMYDDSGDWVSSVGLPAKSGVGGGIISALPGAFGMATFSPPLDDHGSSVRGLRAQEDISADLELHIVRASNEAHSAIRSHTTVDRAPSLIRRSEDEEAALAADGDRAHIIELIGDVRFAGAEVLVRTIEELDDPLCVVIDATKADVVAGVAHESIARLAAALAEADVRLSIIDPDGLLGEFAGSDRVRIFTTRRSALAWAEQIVLLAAGLSDSAEAGSSAADSDAESGAPVDDPLRNPLLEQLDDDVRARVEDLLVDESHPAGMLIRRIDEPFDGIRFIVSGEVHSAAPSGEVLSVLRDGASFGELALTASGQPFAMAAHEDTKVRLLSADAIETLAADDPQAGAALWQAIAREGFTRLAHAMRSETTTG